MPLDRGKDIHQKACLRSPHTAEFTLPNQGKRMVTSPRLIRTRRKVRHESTDGNLRTHFFARLHMARENWRSIP